jgi:hypothetical protein
MGTIINLGLGVVSFAAKGARILLDGKTGGEPDMRFDFNDNCHPGDEHYHAGGEKGGSGLLDFALGVAYTFSPVENNYSDKISNYYCCGKSSMSSKKDLGELEDVLTE